MHIIALWVLVAALLSPTASGRALKQQLDGASLKPAVATMPVLAGGSAAKVNVLTRSHFKARGGALAALGRPALAALKRKARWVGSVDHLAAVLDKDRDLAVDSVNTALLYQCGGLAANASAGELAAGSVPSASDPADVTAAQAFTLSSRPGAAKKIFLDFDGHVTTGTAWNGVAGGDPIVTPPYDKDGSPTTWSADELRDIVAIWRAVSEDYAAFDVDVTTADPGSAALAGNGIRVAIGGSYADWYNHPAGGVAYLSSFGVPDTPCFVFTKNLGPDYAKYVWEAVSHEVGHTLGLDHDGTADSTYFTGQGDWAPIMGAAYYKSITQFDKGEYAGSNNQQDDMAVISGFLPLLRQESGSSLATATPLNASVDAATGVATARASGVVSSAAGNWFTFKAAAGTATLSAAVMAPWAGSANRANLDIQLTLYDNAAGRAVAIINPPGADATTGLGVPATPVALPAGGAYTVAVTGAGAGDVASTGYSSYGSRGQFELVVVYVPCVDCSSNSTAVSNDTVASPSPSPSPSPPPEPSPSPSPAPAQLLRVTSISLAKGGTGAMGYCTVNVYIADAAFAPVSGVRVSGGWSTLPANPLYAAATASLMTNANGVVTFRSGNIPNGRNYSCVFTVGSVVLPGYIFDAASSVRLTKSLAV